MLAVSGTVALVVCREYAARRYFVVRARECGKAHSLLHAPSRVLGIPRTCARGAPKTAGAAGSREGAAAPRPRLGARSRSRQAANGAREGKPIGGG